MLLVFLTGSFAVLQAQLSPAPNQSSESALPKVLSVRSGPATSSPDPDTGNVLRVSPTRSTARLFMGTENRPLAFNAAVARVAGTFTLDPRLANHGALELAIFPAGNGLSPVGADGRMSSGEYPNSANYAELNFKSSRIEARHDGRWEVSGKLTLIRIERPETADPSEAYAGPVYGKPIVSTESRDATFLFSKSPSGADQIIKLTGIAQFSERDFPQIRSAVLDANWPTVVQNRTCEPSPTVGEDYAGQLCTGTSVAVASLPAEYTSVGEDFHGIDTVPQPGDRIAIVVNLAAPEHSPTANMSVSP